MTWYCLSWDKGTPHWVVDEIEPQIVEGRIVGYRTISTHRHAHIRISVEEAETFVEGDAFGYLIFNGTVIPD